MEKKAQHHREGKQVLCVYDYQDLCAGKYQLVF